MKIAIIGTTSYLKRMQEHKIFMEMEGCEVRIPALDSRPDLNELGICEYNKDMIEWADRIHVFWDCRSMGSVFDFGMAFAMGKPIKIIYLESKTFMNFLRQYEDKFTD